MNYYRFINFSYGSGFILDYRYETFIKLCNILNYTKTAKALNLTQPAVSQHIKYLEDIYKVKLFNYRGKTLTITPEGSILYEFSVAMKTSSDKVKEIVQNKDKENTSIKFGTTLTIGEYSMGDILKKILTKYPDMHISMEVDNTKNLLAKLRDGKIDFAILEGHFDKSKYDYQSFGKKDFIAISSPKNLLLNNMVTFDKILNQKLILREKGSGTRDIFEQILYEQNFTLNSLDSFIEIGNMKVIKELVSDNFGISFLYRKSVKEELDNGSLKEINIEGYKIKREFNFVFLKGSLHKKEYNKWFNFFIND